MTTNIKVCPFCGGGATIAEGDGCYWVECWNHACCLSRADDFPSREEAIAAWNTRAPLPAPLAEPGELEEIRKLRGDLMNWFASFHTLPVRKQTLLKSATDAINRLLSLLDAQTREVDGAYLERNRLVALLAHLFPGGIRKTAIEGWSEDWHGCVYIDLPTGQASWHYHDSQAEMFAGLPPYTKPWDGHSTEEKYNRIAALASQPRPAEEAKP